MVYCCHCAVPLYCALLLYCVTQYSCVAPGALTMSDEEEIAQLKQKLDNLKAAFSRKEDEVAAATADAKAAEQEVKRLINKDRASPNTSSGNAGGTQGKMVYMAPSRKLDRFKEKPEIATELSVDDWIEDAKAIILSRNLTESEQAAFIIEHLAGKARREILGRGKSVTSSPREIFTVLSRVFGDGDSLPQLQQRFYSYRQTEKDDIIACSLELVNLYDRIIQLDPSFKPGRETQLKNRLAEAVHEESMQMELRRLNADQPDLSFFDMRDQIIRLMGQKGKCQKQKRDATVREATVEGDVYSLVLKQGEQIAAQQKQIESLLSVLQNKSGKSTVKRQVVATDGKRHCWICNSADHLRKNCPQKKSRSDLSTVTIPSQSAPKAQDLNADSLLL
ncbi:uncharacterized protein [Ptychodera flava]|uniref:uncharacterized protein n=1 Tax=Ptychodera flava TaxID=63121 RepID=UPI00396A6D7A